MRSGMTRCFGAVQASRTPSITMRSVPWPWIFAPILMSSSARLNHLGSRAAFSSTVRPWASTAAISRFSVPVTVTMSARIEAPFRRLARATHEAVLDLDVGAQRRHALDVLVDRTLADAAATGQADAHLAEAGQQRSQHQDRGAHGLDQLVGGLQLVDLVGLHARDAASPLLLGAHAHSTLAA